MKAAVSSREPARPDYQLDPRQAYLEWLDMEARMLRRELWPECDLSAGYTPRNTFPHHFHKPSMAEPPSARAVRVMAAAGVTIPEGVAA